MSPYSPVLLFILTTTVFVGSVNTCTADDGATRQIKKSVDSITKPKELAAMSDIDSSVKVIDGYLRTKRPTYYKILQSGASPKMLDSIEEKFNIKLPKAFRDLYQWKNGQEPSNFTSFVDNREFMPLDEVTRVKIFMENPAETDGAPWNKRLIPFLDNGAGDYVCIELPENFGESARVIEYWHDSDEPFEVVASTFEKWLKGLADSMNKGTYEFDEA